MSDKKTVVEEWQNVVAEILDEISNDGQEGITSANIISNIHTIAHTAFGLLPCKESITLEQAKAAMAEHGMVMLNKNDAISLFVHGERLFFDPDVDASVNFGSALDGLGNALELLRKNELEAAQEQSDG